MGDEDGGDAGFLLNAADFFPGLQTKTGIEVGKRLVEEEDLRFLDEGPGDGDPLLLTARELIGLTLQILIDLDEFGGVIDDVAAFLFG